MNPTARPASFAGHQRLLPITAELVRQQASEAQDNPRRRVILSFHSSDDEPLHRMLNAIQPGSYIRPHRHLTPPKDEALLVLAGSVGFVPFSEEGQPDADNLLLIDPAKGVLGVDFRAGLWHTLIALEPDTVIYEVKPGPWSAATDKEFAPWAPAPDTEDAERYLHTLEELFQDP